MTTRSPLAIGEWYHCFNRGVDKRKIFLTKKDYERFLLLMYIGNGTIPVHISVLKDKELHHILNNDLSNRDDPLVEIGAYALMPNHFHLLMKETKEGGIATFMQKICTGYTMYFNKKNERTGALLSGPFKSKHVADDDYFQQVVSYINLNPVELFEPKWKEGIGNTKRIKKQLLDYPYSSVHEFSGSHRPERKLLGDSVFEIFSDSSVHSMLENAREYYAEKSILKR